MNNPRTPLLRIIAAISFAGLAAGSLATGDPMGALAFGLLLLALTIFP